MTTNEETSIHPWEKLGLGKGPFTWLGISHEVGPIRTTDPVTGIDHMSGAPGQPMGCCDVCGQGIAWVHHVRSADRKEFCVGDDCIKKIHSKGDPIYDEAERAIRRRKNALARKARRNRAQTAREWLSTPETLQSLEAHPHPKKWAAESGKTARDWAEWMLEKAGDTGVMKTASAAKKLLKGAR